MTTPTRPTGWLWIARALRWLITHAGFAALLYMAIFRHSQGAANLATFWVIFCLCVGLACLSTAVVRSAQEDGLPAIPFAIGFTVDCALTGFMVWHGWLWLGVAYFVHALFAARLHIPIDPAPQPTIAPEPQRQQNDASHD